MIVMKLVSMTQGHAQRWDPNLGYAVNKPVTNCEFETDTELPAGQTAPSDPLGMLKIQTDDATLLNGLVLGRYYMVEVKQRPAARPTHPPVLVPTPPITLPEVTPLTLA